MDAVLGTKLGAVMGGSALKAHPPALPSPPTSTAAEREGAEQSRQRARRMSSERGDVGAGETVRIIETHGHTENHRRTRKTDDVTGLSFASRLRRSALDGRVTRSRYTVVVTSFIIVRRVLHSYTAERSNKAHSLGGERRVERRGSRAGTSTQQSLEPAPCTLRSTLYPPPG